MVWLDGFCESEPSGLARNMVLSHLAQKSQLRVAFIGANINHFKSQLFFFFKSKLLLIDILMST